MANKGKKMEFFVKMVLVFFISLLSFSVGTFVGKQVSDSDYRRASLEGELNMERSTASHDEHGDSHGEGSSEEKKEELSQEEIASLTDEFIEAEKKKAEGQVIEGDHHDPATTEAEDTPDDETSTQATNTGHGYKKFGAGKAEDTKKADAHAATAKATPSKEVAKKIETQKQEVAQYKKQMAEKWESTAANKVAHDKAPTTGKPEVRTPSSVLPSVAASAVGRYTVQLASYATETEAKNHAAKLKDKGWTAFYLPAEISGKTWYRVSVGLFDSTAKAKEYQEKLAKEANITSSIVQKIVQ